MKVCTLQRGLRCFCAVILLPLFLIACDGPEERAEKHYQRGMALVEQGEPGKAVLEFRSALEQNDRHVPTHYALGRVFEDLGDFQAAFQQFRHVADLDPAHFEARLKSARFYLIGNDAANAAVEVAALLELDPVRADVQSLRAELALLEGELDEARVAIDEALALDPDNADALAADAVHVLRTKSAGAALERLDAALVRNADSFALHTLKLRILQQTGNADGVGAQLGAMIAAFPDNLRLRETRSSWALASGRPDLARADLEYLVEAQPGDPQAIANLVRIVQRLDGRDAARALLSKFVAEAAEPGQLALMQAQFDIDTDRRDLAEQGLRELIATGVEEADTARLILARLLTAGPDATAAGIAEAERLVDEILSRDAGNTGALAFRAGRLIATDQLDAAIQQIRNGLNADAEDVQLLLLAGRAQELLGNIDLANDRLAKAVRNDGYNPRTSEPYVRFLLRTERARAAEIVLSETARRYPENRQILDLLGFTRVRLGDWHGAEEAARQLARLDPERARQLQAAILIEQEQFTEGAEMLAELPEGGMRRESSIVAAVQAYLRGGQQAQAVAFLDGLLTRNPGDVQALGIRGNLHLVSGELDEAEARYREILRLEPANGDAFSALARLARRRGDAAGATALLDQGIAVAPDNIGLMARRAAQHEKDGEFDKAIALYERVYAKAPGMPMIANNLASLLADHAADNPELVSRAYTIASRLKQSEVPQFRDTYGWTRYLQGEYGEALNYIEPLTQVLPDNPWIWYHLGMVYIALERSGDARTAFETALEKGGSGFARAPEINTRLAGLASN